HSAAVAALVADLGPQRGPSKLLATTGALWLVSAAVHTIVFATSDTAWAGAVSWRKPIVFSLSIGLILWAYGWILDRLPHRRTLAWALAAIFAASCTAEVGLIALQQWRGRASHFNTLESGDALIFGAMGALVAVMSLMLIAVFVWSLIERPSDRVERIAVFAGMAMIMSGLGVGQWLVSLGTSYVEQFDRVPESVVTGAAGSPKFPHAVAFHGIQVFMLTAALVRHSSARLAAAVLTMRLTAVAYLGVLVFSALQTFGGRAPLDLDLVSGPLLAASVLALVVLLAVAGHWWWTTPAVVDREGVAG
ncbi:MAG: hypothetical protein AAGK32_21275, partial [Actinomycetota bacterium]